MTPHEKQEQIKAQIYGSYVVPAATIKKSEEVKPVAGAEKEEEEKEGEETK